MEMRPTKASKNSLSTGTSAAAAIVVAAAFCPLVGVAQQPSNAKSARSAATAPLEQTLVDAIARAEPSVVAIGRIAAKPSAEERRIGDIFGELRTNPSGVATPRTVGAGVIIDRAGLVLTHYLAVREGDRHTVTTIDRATYAATIRATDPRSGLAVLAIDAKASSPQRTGSTPAGAAPTSFSALPFGDAATLRKGQFVIAIGNPYAIQSDGQPTASWGIVTNLARKAPSGTNLNDAPGPEGDYRTTLHHLGTLIQTDAKLGFGTAGGALVNLRGELVGLTTTAATIAGHEQPAGYAIPINSTTRRIIDTLKDGREVEYGMLGVGFGYGPPDATNPTGSRLTLLTVFPGTPAARAGLAGGDVVTRVANLPVNNVDDVQLAISTLPPSTVTTLDYVRGGRSATTNVTLAKLAVAGKKIVTVRPEPWRGIRVDYCTALEGVQLTEAFASGAIDPEGCVLVAEVAEGSEALKAGVRPGMFISHVGGKRVTTPTEFQAAARSAGEKFDVRLTQPVAADAGNQPQPPQPK
jgi:S1-C subfamily serine protease